eukprot:CAMPEP_0168613814 /NCGR_PEP_ID=MMETSP0449_2-20121227/3647_1 /TAXON_ID=1082188 /ORGANISM="Strombidium rassoulzadegani, Strain ras09" /LENGTH=204 /DNA_ID=CAMNT_0008654463 /DNA_START=460 /DNA_END=1075 /DNA_ORIENTATION=+
MASVASSWRCSGQPGRFGELKILAVDFSDLEGDVEVPVSHRRLLVILIALISSPENDVEESNSPTALTGRRLHGPHVVALPLIIRPVHAVVGVVDIGEVAIAVLHHILTLEVTIVVCSAEGARVLRAHVGGLLLEGLPVLELVVEVVHHLVLGEVLELATDCVRLAHVQALEDVSAIDNEEDQEDEEDDIYYDGDSRRVEDPHE